MKKIGVLLISLICLLSLGLSAFASDCDSFDGSNQGDNNYSRWSSPVESYLYACDDGKLMKVQYVPSEGKVVAEYYNDDYQRLSVKTITPELPVFGGFYAVGTSYFLLTGQNNPSQSASVTCFAVTKYDSAWNKIATAELKDCNTTIPFNAGSARFAHSGNYLAVRTSHEMYKSDDGYNHQANVTMLVDMNTMKITDSFTDVANVNYGYVSHSFNQFINIDSDKIVAIDHGDAYPRSVALVKYRQSVSSGKVVTPVKQCTHLDMFEIYGATGDNTTGCSVGGFEITSTGYLVAINSVVQGSSSDVRNVYLCYADKNGTAAVTEILTYYSDKSVSTPKLVKIDEENFIVLWSYDGRVQYQKVNNKGKAISEIFTINADLSDCQPIVHSGKIIWYVWNDSETAFYSINTDDISKNSVSISEVGHNYETVSVKGTQVSLRCNKCDSTRKGNVPSKFSLWWEDLSLSGGNMVSFSSVPESAYHPGKKIRLNVKFTSADINDFEIVSSDESVAKIISEDGYYKLVSVSDGKTVITVRSRYNTDIKNKYNINVSHLWNTLEDVKATCISDGKTVLKCSECGFTKTDIITATGHSMSAYKVTKEATCKATGQKVSTCSACEYKETQEIPLKDHDKNVTIDEVAPTCTKQGKTEGKKCSVCGKITVEQKTVDALGHSLGEYKVTKKPTCTAKGEETAKCTRCTYSKTRDVDRVAHKEVAVEDVVPTCTKQGKSGGKKCSVCGKITVEQKTVDALGHSLGEYKVTKKATCTAKGEETAKCTRCSYTKTRDVDRVAHKEIAIDDVAPTCTKQGKSGGKKCSVCGKITVEQKTVEALGHSLGEYKITKKPTCTAKGEETAKCTRCTYSKTRDVDRVAHKEVAIEDVAPTCTKQGKSGGKKCSVCGKITVEQKTVEALGHSLGEYKVSKKATCTAKGEETAKCTRCSYTKTRDVDRVAHKEVAIDDVAPTCTKQGKSGGKKCSVCGKITVEQKTVDALGHSLGEYKITKKPTCSAKGEETAKCTRCSYTKTRDVDRVAHKEVAVEEVAPTCTKQGKSGGKKCSVCGGITVEQKTVEALGHSLGEYKVTKKPTCSAKGEETAKCTRCSYTKTREVDKVSHKEIAIDDVAPTCTKQGKSGGKKCSVCGKITVEQKTVEALGHSLGEYKITKKPTCSAKGEETAKCSRCSYTKTREVDRVAHKEVAIADVAPTCTKQGKTAGKKCSVCGKITVEQKTVEALGHSLGEYKFTKKPTCTAKGEESAKCTRCSYTKTRDVDKVAHIEVTVKATSPTCTNSGKTAGKKCSVCDKVIVAQENIDALGHEMGEYEITKEATCSAKGEKTAKCSRCSYAKSADIPMLQHKEVTLKAVKATCTKTGKTKGKKCSLCNKTLVAQESVPALGHSKKVKVISKATTKANGKISTKCERCGKDYGETRVYRIQSVTLSKTKYTFDGKAKTPTVTVVDYNKDQLVKDKDYTVTYDKSRKLPGRYKVTVKFKGEYSGTTNLYFEIKPSKISDISATVGKAAVTLKWSAVKGADGYQVYYSSSKDGEYKKLTSTSKTSFKKTSLKSGKTYYFKVRAYKKTDSATIFGSFSSVKSAKIK